MKKKVENLRTGMLFTENNYLTFERFKDNTTALLRTTSGKLVERKVEELFKLSSADFYETEKSITRTELLSMIEKNIASAITIEYLKKTDAKTAKVMAEDQIELLEDFPSSKTKMMKFLKEYSSRILEGGEFRSFKCVFWGNKSHHGYFQITDLSNGTFKFKNLVPSNIVGAIINGVKYTVKK